MPDKITIKRMVIVAAAVVALVLVNVSIAQKEHHIKHGQEMFLELAPVDPRSLMQGDYMILFYKMTLDAEMVVKRRGLIVVTLDDRQVASFTRPYGEEKLKENEHLLAFTKRGGRPQFGIESFFFQEGKGHEYQNARYARIKVAREGCAILTGLLSKDFKELGGRG